jgi:hypothetical protein
VLEREAVPQRGRTRHQRALPGRPDQGLGAEAIPREDVLALQRSVGNRAVARMVAPTSDGEPAGEPENWAVETRPGEQPGSPSPAAAVLAALQSGEGEPLGPALRGRMEARLGADLGVVRLHRGEAAAASAHAVGALAYTVGEDIVLGDGVNPGTIEGERTIAHELVHVLQQRAGPVGGTALGDGLAVSDPGDPLEQAAEATAILLTGESP